MIESVFVVGGLATRARNMPPLTMLGDLFARTGAKVEYLENAVVVDGRLTSLIPSMQIKRLVETMISRTDEEKLIISSSLGAFVSIGCIDELQHKNVRALAISPPLRSPAATMRHPRITARMRTVAGKNILPSFSYARQLQGAGEVIPDPVDVYIPDEYYDEIEQSSDTFRDRTLALVDNDTVRLVTASEDWNTDCLELTARTPNTLRVDSTHSLFSTWEQMQAVAQQIYDFAKAA